MTGWALGELPDGWSHSELGHYLHDTARPVLRYRHDETGREVEVLRVGAWLGEGDYSRAQARDALELLLAVVRDEWADQSIELLTSPATTGRDLLLRSIPHGVSYPVLEDGLVEVLHATAGQGRWQHFGPPTADHVAVGRIVGYDMRFGYAGVTSSLGIGPAEHLDGDGWTHDPYRPGWHRVRFAAPDGWRHLGLFGVRGEDGIRWPAAGETWAHGAELHLAATFGWRLEVVESIVWQAGRPLETWTAKIAGDRRDSRTRGVRGRLADLVRDGQADTATAKLAADAARMLVLQTIGALHGAPHRVTHAVPGGGPWGTDAPDAWPHDDVAQPELRGRWWVYRRLEPGAWAAMIHPEWSASVWAKCRVRLMHFAPKGYQPTGALHVDPAHLLALRQDAVYTVDHDPGWNAGRTVPVGHMRRVVDLAGPRPWPATKRALDDLLAADEQETPPPNPTTHARHVSGTPSCRRAGPAGLCVTCARMPWACTCTPDPETGTRPCQLT